MFIIQLIGALIVLIIETFNRIEFKQSLIYFYYRYGTSLREPINNQIQIENQHTLIYQIKSHFQQIRQFDNECSYLKYLQDESILFQYHIDCAIDAHLNNNIIYIIDYNNCTILSVYQIDDEEIFDVEFYGFNKLVKINLVFQSIYLGEYYKSQFMNQNLYITTIHEQNTIHYVYRDKSINKFECIQQNRTLNFYQSNNQLLIISNTFDIEYISVLNYVKKLDIQFLQTFHIFHKGQQVINIPFETSLNKSTDILNLIVIILDEFQQSIKISIIHYQLSVFSGFGSSSIIYQEEVTNIYDSSFKTNWKESIKYESMEDHIYIIYGTQHYFIRPCQFSQQRYEVIKLNTQTKEIGIKNRIVKLKLHSYNLLVQTYNYISDSNQFYYLNLSTVQQNRDYQQQIQFLKLEDFKQCIHKNTIIDFTILNKNLYSEIMLLLQSGDIVIGQLQYPLYQQILEWAFGSEAEFDDIRSIRTSKIWILITIVLVILKLGHHLYNSN
ncbi:unnamed protein product [Paramecium sonneborni]|uniref:Uncharacterized protein n=1 Tax=Paramecium sonneborni TaxID=65129 RepID=A0A8S1KC79_9CILI|nr:unnamed protein product [Paramecium sonneborni]